MNSTNNPFGFRGGKKPLRDHTDNFFEVLHEAIIECQKRQVEADTVIVSLHICDSVYSELLRLRADNEYLRAKLRAIENVIGGGKIDMGLVDAFSKEDRVPVTFSDFYRLMKYSAKVELLMNAVNCNVPHRYIRETMTGKSEETPALPEITAEDKG